MNNKKASHFERNIMGTIRWTVYSLDSHDISENLVKSGLERSIFRVSLMQQKSPKTRSLRAFFFACKLRLSITCPLLPRGRLLPVTCPDKLYLFLSSVGIRRRSFFFGEVQHVRYCFARPGVCILECVQIYARRGTYGRVA